MIFEKWWEKKPQFVSHIHIRIMLYILWSTHEMKCDYYMM